MELIINLDWFVLLLMTVSSTYVTVSAACPNRGGAVLSIKTLTIHLTISVYLWCVVWSNFPF